MDLLYAVVLFIEEENAPGVVITDWLHSNESKTFYPKVNSNLARDKLLKKMASPDENWREFPVKVLKKYKTLLEAQQALAKAEETSNLSSEDEEEQKKNRRIRKKKRLMFEDEEEITFIRDTQNIKTLIKEKCDPPHPYPSPSEVNMCFLSGPSSQSPPTPLSCHTPQSDTRSISTAKKLRPIPSPRSFPTPLSSQSPSNRIHFPPIQSESSPMSQNYSPHNQMISSPFKTTQNFVSERSVLHQLQMQMTDIYDRQARIELKIDAVLTKLASSSDSEKISPGVALEIFGNFPIKDMEKFEELEEALKDVEAMKQLVRLFASLGGKDVKSCVNTIMRRLMTDDLAKTFSYSGKTTPDQRKLQFSRYSVCKCVQVAVRRRYEEASESVLKGFISVWLQQAKSRTSRRKKEVVGISPEERNDEADEYC